MTLGDRFGISAETLAHLQRAIGDAQVVGGIVLGSGLGSLLETWPTVTTLQGADIPGYPRSTVAGHAGRMAVVRWDGSGADGALRAGGSEADTGGQDVTGCHAPGEIEARRGSDRISGQHVGLVFQGRVHFYEGYERPDVTFAVRLAAALGAGWMIFTNAAGSLDPNITPGTIMVVEDHIRILLLGAGPLQGIVKADAGRGTPYHPGRTEEFYRVLSAAGLRTVRGVLMGCLGPAYETAAEVEMARRVGAQAACMSTVVEVEEAARCGVDAVAASLITNLGTGLSARPLSHEEVMLMAEQIGPQFAAGIAQLVAGWIPDDRD